ncbi:MAG: TonB-dependent siderophore receptor [Gammaproteobacteria bacterium]
MPISRSYGDPNVPEANNDKILVGFNLSHQFNRSWKLENRFLASFLETFDTWPNPAPAFGNALRADNRTLDRNIFGQESDADVYSTNLDLTGNFYLGPTRHDVLLGFDYLRATTDYNIFGSFTVPNPALAIDLFNPTYGIDPTLFTAARSVNVSSPGRNFNVFQEEAYGAYFQDQITLWDKLHIPGGGRCDWAEFARGRGGSFAAAEANVDSVTRKDEEFSPRVGILYQAWPWLSVFGDWTTSFGANNGVTAQNVPVPPQTGEQFEAGLKTEILDHRLGATLAFYHLTRQNLLTPDLSTSDPLDSIPVGKQRSQGIEFDTAGQITDALSLIGSYAYTDGKVTQDNSGLEGRRLFNVPEHAGSLWLKYDFKNYTALNGLTLGFGAFMVGERDGDIQNTFLLPGYVRLDAFAAYRWKLGPSQVTAQLNVRNLLDKDYYESADANSNVAPRNGVSPGEPLTLFGSIRVEL